MKIKNLQWYIEGSCDIDTIINKNDYCKVVKSCSTNELKQVRELAKIQDKKEFLIIIDEELNKR